MSTATVTVPQQRSSSPEREAPRAGLCRSCLDTFWDLDRHLELDACSLNVR